MDKFNYFMFCVALAVVVVNGYPLQQGRGDLLSFDRLKHLQLRQRVFKHITFELRQRVHQLLIENNFTISSQGSLNV